MPPSSTAPLREPASSRTAECPSFCQGDASWARTSTAIEEASRAIAKTNAARIGTIAIMGCLYRVEIRQTIELLVRHLDSRLIDRIATQYQDELREESALHMDPLGKTPGEVRGKA